MNSMDKDMMRLLARMPFLDRLEAVAVSGRSRGALYRSVQRLEEAGLLGSIPHATDLIPLTRRYHLSAAGLRDLARTDGMSTKNLLRRHPVSTRWRRVLLDRLDPLAVIYRLASAVADLAHPMRFQWYRGMPLDAAIALPGGRTIGIFRQGLTSDRSGFSKRLWRLTQVSLPGLILMLMPDEMRLRYAQRVLAHTSVTVLLGLEAEATLGVIDHAMWRLPSVSADIDLRSAIDRLPPGGIIPPERPLVRISLPPDLDDRDPGEDAPEQLLPAMLRPAEKRALDLLSDWPWLGLRDLAGMMGVSRPRTSQIVAALEEFGLVLRTSKSTGKLALSDSGLAMLARRDRTSVGVAKKRWSATLLDDVHGLQWRNVAGRRSRQLLRHPEHTAAVHGFVATLAGQARDLGWEIVQMDPPIRASRYFRHLDGVRSIQPDAFGLLRRGDVRWPFFLEWERRAVRPVTMAERLAPYLRYYGTRRPADDHGSIPRVLVVFNDQAAATGFLRMATEKLKRISAELPLLVSHRDLIDVEGPLGRAWQTPGRWEPERPLPSS